MKKILGVGVATLLLAVPLLAFAADFRAGDQPSIKSGETVNNDVYMVGGTVTSAGTVDGDLLAGGGTITISGPVNGNVMAAGGDVTVIGNVSSNVRVAGGNVVVQGAVKGDVLAAGGTISIDGAKVGRDLAVAGGTVHIDAPVSGSVKIAGGNIYLNSTINGDVSVRANKLTLGSGAVINGRLNYTSPQELTRESGAVTKGPVNFTPGQPRQNKAALAGVITAVIIWKFIALLVCALIIGLFFKRYAKEVTDHVVAEPAGELGRGLVIFIVYPIVAILLLITVVGIPLGLIGLLSFGALLLLTWIISAIVLGSILSRYFFKHEVHQVTWQTILLGTVVYAIIGLIPVIGKLFEFLLLLAVLGAAMNLKWNIIKGWRK